MERSLEKYSLVGILELMYFKFRTYLLFRNARLIRFPFRLRGKKYIYIGKNFTTGFNCRIDAFGGGQLKNLLIIGDNVQINDSVHLAAVNEVRIGNNVLIASNVFITDHNHGDYSGSEQDSPYTPPSSRPLHSQKVVIADNVWIGEYVVILPGVTIGEGSIIGSSSVVSKSVPPFSIAVGSPARIIKKYNFDTTKWEKV